MAKNRINSELKVANGRMRTKGEIKEVLRAGWNMVESDLSYLEHEQFGDDDERYADIMDRIANRLAVMSARVKLAHSLGGEE